MQRLIKLSGTRAVRRLPHQAVAALDAAEGDLLVGKALQEAPGTRRVFLWLHGCASHRLPCRSDSIDQAGNSLLEMLQPAIEVGEFPLSSTRLQA
jgi:hypothetical protein